MSLKIPTYTKAKLLGELTVWFPKIKSKDIITLRKKDFGTVVTLTLQNKEYSNGSRTPGKAYLKLLQSIRIDVQNGLLKVEKRYV